MPSKDRSQPKSSTDQSNDSAFLSQFSASDEQKEWFSPTPKGYQKGRTKFVVVIGTVMSGLGKGIFSSSLAKLLKDKGLAVAPIKMEGYLNIDSGTLNPFRHGEVFVLEDGLETDMDLGTYERILEQNLSRRNFVTAGQIYGDILDRERRGDFLGRDVQMIPHVTGTVKMHLRQLAMTGGPDGGPADVVFVEVGGTAGDYENGFYIEALRELAFEEGPESTCFVALTYILEPATLGEQKSKAAQLGIKRLMECGVQPQVIACRATNPVTEKVMQKIGMFSNVPLNRIFSMHDRESIYFIPDAMREAGLDREILSLLQLHNRVNAGKEDQSRRKWSEFSSRLVAPRAHRVTIGVMGKYASLRDAYASIDKAVEHCGIWLNASVDLKWMDTSTLDSKADVAAVLQGVDGIIVPGGFGQRGVEGKILCVEYARTTRLPFLGICLGFQMAVIEYARNVLGLADANSTEFDAKTVNAFISELPDQKKLEGIVGGTMRLGAQDVVIEPGSFAQHLYKSNLVRERFRHRYEVEPQYIDALTKAGLHFSGRHPKHPIMQVLELSASEHPCFVAAQFHPELTSRPTMPQPLFMGLIAAALIRKYPQAASDELIARWLNASTATAAAR